MQSALSKLTWRECALQSVLLLALLAVLFPTTFFRGEMIAPGDILFEIPPWSNYGPPAPDKTSDRLALDALTAMNTFYVLAERALEQGEWPLWNHLELAGMPLLANCQSAVFYPPRLLHAFLDPLVAYTIYIVLKLWLCGMTAYLCARGIGLSRAASRFASVGWMLSSYNLLWCYWPLPDVSVWFPVLFLGVEFILDGRHRKGFYTATLGATLFLFAGHPETAFLIGLGLGLYFLLRLVLARRRGRALWIPIAVAGGAWGLALLVYAVQLLPFLEYLANSFSFADRSIRPGGQRGWLSLSTVAGFWVPRFFGTWVEGNFWGKWNSNLIGMIYAGAAVWVAIALLPAKAAADPKTRARVLCLAVVGGVFMLSAFKVFPMQLIHALPVFNTIYEHYHAAFAMFALPLLGGIGLDRWFSRPRKLRELAWCIPLAGVAVSLIAVVCAFNKDLALLIGMADYVRGKLLIAAVLSGLCLLLFGV